jgi:acyl-CoA thioesterase-2
VVDLAPSSSFLTALTLTGEPARQRGISVSSPRPVVFGGQLLGQVAIAANRAVPDKSLRSVQILFARAGLIEHDLWFSTEVLHDGRSVGSVRVRCEQIIPDKGNRLICEALVLLGQHEPDLIAHTAPIPDIPGPDSPDAADVDAEEGSQIRLVGGPSVFTAEHQSEATTHAWVRFDQGSDDEATKHALLAWYTDGFLIGTAMRPHSGIGQENAHESVSTGVLSHTITFHQAGDPTQWNLLTQTSTQAGAGRCYGTGAVYSADGTLLASFAQEGMIRSFAVQGQRGTASMAM